MSHNQTCSVCRRRLPKKEFLFLPETVNAQTSNKSKGTLCRYCQWVRAEERKQNPEAQRKWEMRPYKTRNYILRSMGFASYADYLASDLWQKIRARVLDHKKHACEMCGGRATQVHHNLYDKRVLCGQSMKGMKALCRECHERIEFQGGKKIGLVEASHRVYTDRPEPTAPPVATGKIRRRLTSSP